MNKKRDGKKVKKQPKASFGEQAKQWHADVQGSYTGNPLYDDQPVQDADDL